MDALRPILIAAMAVLLGGCELGSSLGSPESFQALTGVPLRLTTRPPHCSMQSGGEVVGEWIFDFGPAATEALMQPPSAFWTYPRLDLGVETNRTVHWAQGLTAADDQKAFAGAASIAMSTQQKEARGDCSDQAFRADLRALLEGPTVYFSYLYRVDDHRDFRYNLHFLILDAANGRLYELIDTSGTSFNTD